MRITFVRKPTIDCFLQCPVYFSRLSGFRQLTSLVSSETEKSKYNRQYSLFSKQTPIEYIFHNYQFADNSHKSCPILKLKNQNGPPAMQDSLLTKLITKYTANGKNINTEF